MDSDADVKNNPWAQYLSVNSLYDLEYTSVNCEPTCEYTYLSPDDMPLYGWCPAVEDLSFVSCKQCNQSPLSPSIKWHMEQRHRYKEEKMEIGDCSATHVLPAPPPVTHLGTYRPFTTTAFPRASAACSSASAACSGLSVARSSSVTSSVIAETSFPFDKNGSLPSVSANTVRVKLEDTKSKAVIPSCDKGNKATKSLPVPQQSLLILSEQFEIPSAPSPCSPQSSMFPSPLRNHRHSTDAFRQEPSAIGTTHNYGVLTTSASLVEKMVDNSESSQTEKKTPVLEKLVIRRVLQPDPQAPDASRQSAQGMKGVAQNKKDSSQETYFMVVKQKDRQHNLLAARKQIRKQSNVVNQEKTKVDQKMKKLENVREQLMNQLFSELQNVKIKLNQCNVSKSELQKELSAVRQQFEESKKITDSQNELLGQQNGAYLREINDLKKKIDSLTDNTASLIEEKKMFGCFQNNDVYLFPTEEPGGSRQPQTSEQQKFFFQARLEELETQLRELKDSSLIEKRRLEQKLHHYGKYMTELKKRLIIQINENEILKAKINQLEKNHETEAIYEVYPGLKPSTSNIATTTGSTEKFLQNIQNIWHEYQLNVSTSQMSSDRSKVVDEEVS